MTPEHPSVSIVMPARDAEATLGHAMASIVTQTWKGWELIVVDDGSSDATSELLESHQAGDPRIRVLRTEPLGIVSALQRGCEVASGEWIARMDADDWMHPERIQRQLEHADQYPEVDVVSCKVGFGGDAAGYAAHVDWINRQVSPEEISLRRFIDAPVAHPSVMFRRRLIEKHGGYRDGDFPEDYELWLRWLDAGVRFGKVERELLVWNDPVTRLSRNDPRYEVGRFYETKCHWLAKWVARHVSPERRVWLWGAGRVTRRRFDALESEGVAIEGFVDVDPKKVNRHRDGRMVRHAEDLPDPSEAYLVVGVGNRGAREWIHDHLTARGWVEGHDFILAA